MTWQHVTRSLLARWPSQRWDREQAIAYVAELERDGLTPEDAMRGIRVSESAFVPSVGELRRLSRVLESSAVPTFEEAYAALWGVQGILHSPRYEEKARALHPLIALFVERMGRAYLMTLAVTDEDTGHWRRKDLLEAWGRHVEACEGRELAVLVAGRGAGRLDRLEPLEALGLRQSALPSGA